ncbi:glutathione S-transferase [Gonapodya prolifera JEL478]|uniref:Glutathione S-transferase n=1 Tax=Gonapodya prolifera (strain JEL478) TaxID=1344416 RepID=A0A138ZZ67_GONPJ|nr:glutathione S-transferase [Gonapodya prolifera JEL478]|eukprot:KXS09781.1 glutathione S-transferase [Gonapodya prolifera JEL478]
MPDWTPPQKIESLYAATDGNNFSAINAPTAGARVQKALPRGPAKYQLYSAPTPNGFKASIALEEFGVDYDAWTVNISKAEQFTSGFVGVNPNSKIPAMYDYDTPSGEPIRVFESGAIVVHLALKYGKFFPQDPAKRAEVLSWVFWQVGGQGPMTGNFGHFFVYAPGDKHEARNYGVARYGMEVQRLCDVLEKHLADGRPYLVGDEYTIADMMCMPWFLTLRGGYKHSTGTRAREFLGVDKYKHAMAWCDRIMARPPVKRGLQVCVGGVGKPWLKAKV